MYKQFLILKLILVFPLISCAANFTGNIPKELLPALKYGDCRLIEDHYEKEFSIDPPYIYGVNTSIKTNSAAILCEANSASKNRQYKLIVVERKNAMSDFSRISECKSDIIINQSPGGLSLVNKEMNLSSFYYYPNLKRKGPDGITNDGPLLSLQYEGEGMYLYCYEGEWLFITLD